MEERTDCITMVTEDGDEVVFSVLEETRIHGKDYLLVTDAPEDEDGECYILKDVSGEQEPDAVYEFVEDDRELDSVMGFLKPFCLMQMWKLKSKNKEERLEESV